MPTENRSSNTEQMFSVPEGYMLVERSIWTEQQVEAATACITLLKVVPGMRDRDLAMAAIDAAQCKAPDIRLSDLLTAAQPLGWVYEGGQEFTSDPDRAHDLRAEGIDLTAVYGLAQHQGEPVAYAVFADNGNIRIWSTDCEAVGIKVMQEEGKQAVPLYAHPPTSDGFSAGDMADQGAKAFAARDGEVERLRELEETLRTSIFNISAEKQKLKVDCKRLLDKMAERDALLRLARQLVVNGVDLGYIQMPDADTPDPAHDLVPKIDAALSASAEPKPFTTPDCPDCACVQDGQCLCTPSKPSAEPSAPTVHPINMKTMMQAYEQVDHKALLHGTSNWCAAMATALRCALHGEPSAPVERDERAEFEADQRSKGFAIDILPGTVATYMVPAVRFSWAGWQARAALERKS